MKKAGILNRHLAGALAELGHGDRVLVCDAGMPVPAGPRVVDLAFRAGIPSFADVLEGLLDELVIEGATAAREVGRRILRQPGCWQGAYPIWSWSHTTSSRRCRQGRGWWYVPERRGPTRTCCCAAASSSDTRTYE